MKLVLCLEIYSLLGVFPSKIHRGHLLGSDVRKDIEIRGEFLFIII